jgi:hypothetical protein
MIRRRPRTIQTVVVNNHPDNPILGLVFINELKSVLAMGVEALASLFTKGVEA